MFEKKAEKTAQTNPAEVHTILGPGSKFEGKLVFEGTVRIDGELIGDVFTKGMLIIGDGGRVNGNIQVESIEVNGELEGSIISLKKVSLNTSARVKGEISTPLLEVEEGAIFNGNIKMTDSIKKE